MTTITTILVVAGVAAAWAGPAAAQSLKADIAAGRALARENCAECHAISEGRKSRRKEAPPFNTLWKRYKIDDLQEAFAEGVAVGHRGLDMPEFTFQPDEADALIAYIKSLKK